MLIRWSSVKPSTQWSWTACCVVFYISYSCYYYLGDATVTNHWSSRQTTLKSCSKDTELLTLILQLSRHLLLPDRRLTLDAAVMCACCYCVWCNILLDVAVWYCDIDIAGAVLLCNLTSRAVRSLKWIWSELIFFEKWICSTIRWNLKYKMKNPRI